MMKHIIYAGTITMHIKYSCMIKPPGEMAWWLRAPPACAEHQNLVPVDQQLINACDSRSRGSEALYALSRHSHTHMHVYTQT